MNLKILIKKCWDDVLDILYIHQYYKTREGSYSTRSFAFAKRYVDAGHNVTMLTGDSRLTDNDMPISTGLFSSRYNIEGIEVIAIKNKCSNYMSKLKRIYTFISFLILSTFKGLLIKSHDVIYATSTPLTVGFPAMVISKFKRTPYVFEVRDLWPEAPIQMGVIKNNLLIKVLKKFERKIYKNASHIVALSPGMEQGVLKENVPKSKVSMLPNSSDLDLFSKENSKPMKYIEKYNLAGDFVAIHPGSMGVANGLFYLVEAA